MTKNLRSVKLLSVTSEILAPFIGKLVFVVVCSLDKVRRQERRDARLAREATELEALRINEQRTRERERSEREAQMLADRQRLILHLNPLK